MELEVERLTWVRYWLTSIRRRRNTRRAARAKRTERNGRFVEALGRRLSCGSTVLKDMSMDLHAPKKPDLGNSHAPNAPRAAGNDLSSVEISVRVAAPRTATNCPSDPPQRNFRKATCESHTSRRVCYACRRPQTRRRWEAIRFIECAPWCVSCLLRQRSPRFDPLVSQAR